jgi:hypothetical protein
MGVNALNSEVKRLNRNFLISSIIILLIVFSVVFLNFSALSETLLIIISVIMISFVGYVSFILYRRYTDYRNHPIIKKIMKMKKSDEVLHSLEKDLENLDNAVKIKNTFITKSWIINRSFLGFEFYPLSNVSWVYPKITRHYINFIPTGVTYGIVIILDSFKKKIEHSCTEEESHNLIRYFTYKTPWADFGYKDELGKKHKLPFISSRGDKIAIASIAIFVFIIFATIFYVSYTSPPTPYYTGETYPENIVLPTIEKVNIPKIEKVTVPNTLNQTEETKDNIFNETVEIPKGYYWGVTWFLDYGDVMNASISIINGNANVFILDSSGLRVFKSNITGNTLNYWMSGCSGLDLKKSGCNFEVPFKGNWTIIIDNSKTMRGSYLAGEKDITAQVLVSFYRKINIE